MLNSCEGARTTINDPYAGVATTLIQLGMPAVVAMQFEISDEAAILFADELYTNLIGRQDPIDAAVAEARKAIYIEIDRVEWATPVLFVRDPEVQLFDFKVPVAPPPPPPPPDALDDEPKHARGDADADGNDPDGPITGEVPAVPRGVVRPPRRAVPVRIAAGVGAAVVALGAGLFVVTRDDGTASPTTATVASAAAPTTAATTAPTTTATTVTVAAPRRRTGSLAVQILEPDGDTHLYPVDLASTQVGIITNKARATDTQPVWDRRANRVAFTRSLPASGPGTGIFYVVPGDAAGDQGKVVAPLVPWLPGRFDHFPAWTADGALLYLRTDGCTLGRTARRSCGASSSRPPPTARASSTRSRSRRGATWPSSRASSASPPWWRTRQTRVVPWWPTPAGCGSSTRRRRRSCSLPG